MKRKILLESLKAIELKFLRKRIKNFLNGLKYEIFDENETTRQFSVSIEGFSENDWEKFNTECLSKFGYMIAKRNNNISIIRPFYHLMTTENDFMWEYDKAQILKGKFYHISTAKISNQIRCKHSSSNYNFEKYDNRIYLLSSYLANRDQVHGGTISSVMHYLIERLKMYYKDKAEKLYVYECRPVNDDIHIDPAFSSGVFVKENIVKFKLIKIVKNNFFHKN